MMRLLHNPAGPVVRPSLTPWEIGYIEHDRVIGATGASETTIQDSVYTEQPSETVVKEFEVTIEVEPPSTAITIENLTPDLISLNGTRATYIADGKAIVRVLVGNNPKTVSYEVRLSTTGGELVWNRFAAGTLARFCEDVIRSGIAGKTASVAMPMFSSLTLGSTGVRNPDNWLALAGYDTSCISINRPNTLHIASDLGVQAKHYMTDDVDYVAMDGTVYGRTVLQRYTIDETDLSWVRYAPVPADIVPAVMPPANLEAYIPTLNPGCLCITCDQEKKLHLARLASHSGVLNYFSHPGVDLSDWYEDKISGDSGSNALMPHPDGSRLIGLNPWWFGGAGAGPAFDDWLTELAAAHTALGCVGAYEIADLSAFPTF